MMTPNRSGQCHCNGQFYSHHPYTNVYIRNIRTCTYNVFLEGICDQHARHFNDIRKEHLCADLELNSKM